MLRYSLKRLLSLVISLVVASLIIFAVIEVAPGDPPALCWASMPSLTRWQRCGPNWASTCENPAISGLGRWDAVGGFRHFVYLQGTGWANDCRSQWVSLPLALMALTLSTVIALPVGLYAANRRGGRGDMAVMGLTQLGIAVPNFWFAMILVVIFAINLRWFSAGGFPGWDAGLLIGLKALTLPAVALGFAAGGDLVSGDAQRVDRYSERGFYAHRARQRADAPRQTLWRHGLRNALIPVLTIMGLQFSFLLAGAIIIEQVFYLPGLGRLVFQSISQRDLIVVESVVMLLVFAVIVVNFAVDLAYAAVDPRLRSRL